MLDLYLMRHGIAVESRAAGSAADAERPLTPEGREKVVRAARWLAALAPGLAAIHSSPCVRARQTAEIVAESLQLQKRLVLNEALAPEAAAGTLIRSLSMLRPPPKALLLIGHEPGLGELAGLLLTGRPGALFAFKKAGIAKLTVTALTAGRCATLDWLITPRALMGMQ
ncbi:MAG TPA: phosphohistidine phosphatase SixA [Verrucomicrobiota bacterium]|nr:phosphohistidine phosphatase SixA [Verrucomicrobiota bacterium]